MSKPIVAVFGATGHQGGSVVRALRDQGAFTVRALTRAPEDHPSLGDEVRKADLDDPSTLAAALEGAHGVFLVTNFWEGADEEAQGKRAVEAAREAGVKHFIWSTLPHVKNITGGEIEVAHFDHKAAVDPVVESAGFAHVTFVEAPFYYQNLATVMTPQPQEDGTESLPVPIDPDARVLHVGDADELGDLVAGAFAHPDKVGHGEHLGHYGDTLSFNEMAGIMNECGRNVRTPRVPADVYDDFYEGASEMRAMMQYFEAHTYFGPDAEKKMQLGDEVRTRAATRFSTWAREHLGSE